MTWTTKGRRPKAHINKFGLEGVGGPGPLGSPGSSPSPSPYFSLTASATAVYNQRLTFTT